MNTVVHVTHEAVEKIGGIGAVLEGLITSKPYQENVGRTILVQPLFTTAGGADGRLGPHAEVLYSSLDGRLGHQYHPVFDRIKRDYNVEIVYGQRSFPHPGSELTSRAEVLLIDVHRMEIARINQIKLRLWERYRLQSDRYEGSWDYDQYVKLAGPALACLSAIGACPPKAADSHDSDCVIVAHEFMGMPTALLAAADPADHYHTAFYAHEVATMRRLVEESPGHDVMFYNVLRRAVEQQKFVQDVFGDQHGFFKHPLIDRARLLDNVLAVGDYVVKELRFMGPDWEQVPVDLSYNGIPARQITLARKQASRARIRQYVANLLDYEPDYLFTHVTRMAPSKGLWRDLEVLAHLDREFGKRGWTGAFLMLSCGAAPRRSLDVLEMERDYNWPVAHREGLPDLSPPEAAYYAAVQHFNARARNIKAVFLNQFGFDRQLAGLAVPPETTFEDLQIATDVEFGQSIYEPFGIAMLEPLTYGGLCVISTVCGCKGFVDEVTEGGRVGNVIVADYTDLDGQAHPDIGELLRIGREERLAVEQKVSRRVAEQVLAALPTSDAAREKLLKSGYQIARHMSWDVVAGDYFLPALERACRGRPALRIAAG